MLDLVCLYNTFISETESALTQPSIHQDRREKTKGSSKVPVNCKWFFLSWPLALKVKRDMSQHNMSTFYLLSPPVAIEHNPFWDTWLIFWDSKYYRNKGYIIGKPGRTSHIQKEAI